MIKNLKRLYVTEKDLSFISYLHAVKVATYEQIQRDTYPRLALGTVCNRVRKFHDNGLVEINHGRLLLDGKRLVSLSKKAFKVFIQTGEEVRVELKSDSPKHDLELCDIRSRMLTRPSILVYKTENEIQTWPNPMSCLNSDALIHYRIGSEQFRIPVEYERVSKTSRRYEGFISKYYEDDSTACTLVITENQNQISKLMAFEHHLFPTSKSKLFFATLQDVLESGEIRFKNRQQIQLVI